MKSNNVIDHAEVKPVLAAIEKIQELQYLAVGGRLRPDQAVGFILQSEYIRMKMVRNYNELEKLVDKANFNLIGY
jgi:hypothetical protein